MKFYVDQVHPELIGDIFLPLIRSAVIQAEYQLMASSIEASLTFGRMKMIDSTMMSRLTIDEFDRLVFACMYRVSAAREIWNLPKVDQLHRRHSELNQSIWRAKFYCAVAQGALLAHRGFAGTYAPDVLTLIMQEVNMAP